MNELDDYLQEGSPFLPEVTLSVVNSILRTAYLEPSRFVGHDVAFGIAKLGGYAGINMLARVFSKHTTIIYHGLKFSQEGLKEFVSGYSRPLQLLMIAGIATTLVENKVGWETIFVNLASGGVGVEDFRRQDVIKATTLMSDDPTGRQFINWFVDEQCEATPHIYHKIGLKAAKRTFHTYLDILETLLPKPLLETFLLRKKPETSEPLSELLPAQPQASSSQQTTLFEDTIRQLTEPLSGIAYAKMSSMLLFVPDTSTPEAKLADELAAQWKKHPSQGGGLVLVLRMLFMPFRHPHLLKNFFRNRRFFGPIPQDLEEKGKFASIMQRLRNLSSRAATDEGSAVSELQREWLRLLLQPDLAKYSSLWTAVHIAFGYFCEKRFTLTNNATFLELARRTYTRALGMASGLWKVDPGTHYVCGERLGSLYCEYGQHFNMSLLQRVRAIHDTYLDLLKVNEDMYQQARAWEMRGRLQVRNGLSAARVIESCLYMSKWDEAESIKWRREALMVAEMAKSRMLREEMALADRLPPEGIPAHLCESEEQHLDRLRQIYAILNAREHLPPDADAFKEFDEERDQLRRDLEQIWVQMEDGGDLAKAYVSQRRDMDLQWGDLRWEPFQAVANKLGKEFALVSVSRLPGAILLSVLRAGNEAPEICEIPLSDEDLHAYLENYGLEIVYWPELQRFLDKDELPARTNQWQTLGEVLFAPLEQFLYGIEYVYFLPHADFHNVPLHALTLHGEPFIKRWGVAYAPSMSVLESTLSRPKRGESVLVMGYAPPEDGDLTKVILREAEEVAQYFDTTPILRDKATREVLKERGISARLIHISCHGTYELLDKQDPLGAGLALADYTKSRKPFSARDWLGLRLQADLVTLSACLLGRNEVRPGDDLVGNMRAVLFAGASSLLTCLWSVNAQAAREWVLEFYKILDKSRNKRKNGDIRQIPHKIIAFREATLKLQEAYPERPDLWGSFVLVGSGF